MEFCLRCKGRIETNDSAVAISLFCQTVGMGKRRASKSERLYLCPECAVVTGMGEEPPKSQPLHVAAYRIIRYLVGTDPTVSAKAFQELSQSLVMPELVAGEILPPARRLGAAS